MEGEDYMGDLSKFLPSESTTLNFTRRKPDGPPPEPKEKKKPKFSKAMSWQEKRRLERERRQREEDEETLAKMEECAIPESSVGFKLLQRMGYEPGRGGRADPVGIEIRRTRVGIGREDPEKERMRLKLEEAERDRRRVEEMAVEFGDLQKSRWRGRRVVVNFRKAKAALDQLEDREVVVVKKAELEEGEAGGEEEEEEIAEEDLQEILMKLRDEHRYCLFCGFQYETSEALLPTCPGIDEDDHWNYVCICGFEQLSFAPLTPGSEDRFALSQGTSPGFFANYVLAARWFFPLLR